MVLISGPIASGKSALSRAVAARLEESSGASSAVIDLDLVYEMLWVRDGRKNDERVWRRLAGLPGASEACFWARAAQSSWRAGTSVRRRRSRSSRASYRPRRPSDFCSLSVDFETALTRAHSNPARGRSKDAAFLSRHYAEFRTDWSGRDVLKLDTGSASLAETARSVVEWLTLAR